MRIIEGQSLSRENRPIRHQQDRGHNSDEQPQRRCGRQRVLQPSGQAVEFRPRLERGAAVRTSLRWAIRLLSHCGSSTEKVPGYFKAYTL